MYTSHLCNRDPAILPDQVKDLRCRVLLDEIVSQTQPADVLCTRPGAIAVVRIFREIFKIRHRNLLIRCQADAAVTKRADCGPWSVKQPVYLAARHVRQIVDIYSRNAAKSIDIRLIHGKIVYDGSICTPVGSAEYVYFSIVQPTVNSASDVILIDQAF